MFWDMLKKADISSWAEIIPVHPTNKADSALISDSIFVINCLLIFFMPGTPFSFAFWYKLKNDFLPNHRTMYRQFE